MPLAEVRLKDVPIVESSEGVVEIELLDPGSKPQPAVAISVATGVGVAPGSEQVSAKNLRATVICVSSVSWLAPRRITNNFSNTPAHRR